MPHPSKRSRCKRCGGHWTEVGEISWRGNCAPCGDRAAVEQVNQLRDHTGPEFLHYRRQMAAAFGAVLLDDLARED